MLSATAPRHLVLLPQRSVAAGGARPRRYRLARLQINPPPGRPPERLADRRAHD